MEIIYDIFEFYLHNIKEELAYYILYFRLIYYILFAIVILLHLKVRINTRDVSYIHRGDTLEATTLLILRMQISILS